MPLFTRDLLIKTFAALLIIGFVVELFIVYTYSPQQQAPIDALPAASAVQEDYMAASLAPFVIQGFSDSLFFECNATSLPALTGLLGSPVQVGSTANGKFFFARTTNNSMVSNITFTLAFLAELKPACGDAVVLYREARVTFNGTTSVELTSANQLNRTTIVKRQLDGYTDRLGRGAVALVSDIFAKEGDVVEVRVAATLVNGNIVPGSLLLEQPVVPNVKEVSLSFDATVLSFTGKRVVLVKVPWENRTIRPVETSGVSVIREDFEPLGVIVVSNFTGNESSVFENVSFVNSTIRNGMDVALFVGNFTDRQAAEAELLNRLPNSDLVFPNSTYLLEFNSTNVLASGFETLFYKEAELQALNASSLEVVIPGNFTGLVEENVLIGQNVSLVAKATVVNGVVSSIVTKQASVKEVEG